MAMELVVHLLYFALLPQVMKSTLVAPPILLAGVLLKAIRSVQIQVGLYGKASRGKIML